MNNINIFEDLPELFETHYSSGSGAKQIDYCNGALVLKRSVAAILLEHEKLILWLILKNYHENGIYDWHDNYRHSLNEWILYGKKREYFFVVFLELLTKYAKNNKMHTRHLAYLNQIKLEE